MVAEHHRTDHPFRDGGQLDLHPQHTVHSPSRGTDHTALPRWTAIPHNEIPADQEESSWLDGRVFVAHEDYTDHEPADGKHGDNVLDALVYGVSCGAERLLSACDAVDDLVSALAESELGEPELGALLGELIPGPTVKGNVTNGLPRTAGVDDILRDKLH